MLDEHLRRVAWCSDELTKAREDHAELTSRLYNFYTGPLSYGEMFKLREYVVHQHSLIALLRDDVRDIRREQASKKRWQFWK